MALNFNTTPYYDDFDTDKNFHRILFRPGRAVQARELTQSQTILQDQLKKFGNHIFKDGSRVTGAQLFSIGEGSLVNLQLFQQPTINHINLQSTLVDTGITVNVASFVGQYITSNTGNVSTGLVKNIFFIHHADAAVDSDPDTLYVSHIRQSNVTSENLSNVSYIGTENLTKEITNSANLQIFSTADLNPSNLTATVAASATDPFGFKSKVLGVEEGVYFTNGVFVKNSRQLIAVDKYGANANVTVGFDVVESIVDSTSDTTLLDPALDSSNYLAPGGDRYKITLTLAKKLLDSTNNSLPNLTTNKYIELVRYKNGQLIKDTSDTRYDDLGRTLAKRTFDESGDYIVEGLDPRIMAFGNSTAFLLNISRGKAYVKGYEVPSVENDQKLIVNRARDQESITGHDIETFYGNFINVTGANNGVFNSNTSERVELFSSNTVIDDTTKIGEAYVKNQVYVSGSGFDTVHKLHLFDVKRIANTGGITLPISLTKTIQGTQFGTANCNVDSSSITTFVTSASVTNNSSELIVSNPSGIRIGDEVFGHNVSEDLYSNERRVYVTDIQGSTVTLTNTSVSKETTNNYTFRRATLTDTNHDVSVFEGSYDVIASINDINYNTRRVFKTVSFTSGTATISSRDGTERFKEAASNALKSQFYQIVIRTGGSSYDSNAVVDLDNTSITFATSSTPGNPDDLTIDLADTGFNGTADILTTIDITGAARRTKTSNSHFKLFDEIGNASSDIVRSLGVTDVVNISAIYISNTTTSEANSDNVNVVQYFTFDSGQKDSFYDHATIRLKPSGIGQVNTGKVNVVYSRLTHTGTGHFDANSYPVYEEIPQYIKRNNGVKIDLRDSIDFRPTRTDDETSNVYSNTSMTFRENQIVDSRVGSVDVDLSYYLGRIDKIVLGYDGQFRVLQGKSALNNPPTPLDQDNAMTLYKLTFPPYTYKTSNVKIDIVKNKRYTMKDIGAIDDRLSRVEYYTSLNLLEQEISASSFFNDDNVQLINNGFLVDDFKGHSVGDVLNPDYKCSIDYNNKILHPRFKANGTNVAITTTGLVENSNVLTLPFTTGVYAAQNVASSTTNINPFNVVSFVGYVKLDTDVTTYADFGQEGASPIVAINNEGNSDNYDFGVNFLGSKWDEWLALAYTDDTTRVYTYYDTNGQIKSTSSASESGILSTKTADDKIFYYMAPEAISFEIFGFKPNTPVFAYIDGIHISSDLRSYNSVSGQFDSQLPIITDDSGFANGAIIIQNDTETNRKFASGEHLITFVDNFERPNAFSTIARTRYFSGTPESRKPKKVERVQQNNSSGQGEVATPNCFFYWDIVEKNPNCLTKAQEDARLVRQGYISQSAINNYSNMIVQAYAEVFNRRPDIGGYQHWLSEMPGEAGHWQRDGTKEDLINWWKGDRNPDGEWMKICPNGTDPLSQTFFVNEAANPRGIFVPAIDVFFSSKDVALPVTLELRTVLNGYPTSEVIQGSQKTLKPEDVVIPSDLNIPEATRFTFDFPIFLEPGEYAMVLLTNSSEYNVYIATIGQNRLDTGQSVVSQPYLGSLFKSQNATTWTAEQDSDLCFVLLQCLFDTTGTFTAKLEPKVNNLPFQNIDVIRFDAPFESFGGPLQSFARTDISFTMGLKANGASSLDTAFEMIPNSDIYLQNRKEFGSQTDANVIVSMSSTSPDISPLFEAFRSRFIFVENLINASSNSEVVARPETLAFDGGASSKYITKKVTLSEGFNAQDLRVIIAKNLPQGSSVEVYYRVQNDLDNSTFDELPFVLMTQVTSSVTTQNILEYYDCEYKAENITYTSEDILFDTFRYFQIKIVLYANNTANAPTIKNLRAVALS